MATELAKAYVQIVPSAQGIQGSIANVMNGEGSGAGESAGKSFASSFAGIAKKAIVGLGIGKAVADGIANASEFQTAMAKTSTLFSGTEAEFSALQGEILNLSSSYGLAATTLAEAAYSAESAGVPMEQLGSMLNSSAQLALAGFTDIDTALSATAKTMNAYGEAAMSAEDIQKILIQTQNLGITTVGELGASLANVTPTAAAVGVGFDQVGAALAQMTAAGVPTAQATTQLRSAMTELGKSGTKADLAFREAAKNTQYAGKSFQEAVSSGANLGDVFGLMQAYADEAGLSMVDLWGSVEAGNAAMLIAGDVDKFNSNLDAMATEADVVGEAYGKMSNTLGNSLSRLKESATNFMTTLFNGGDISASFDTMLANVGDVAGKLGGWLETGLKTLGANLPNMMESLLNFGGTIIESLANVDWIDLGVTIINGIVSALGTLGQRLIEIVGGAISGVINGEDTGIDFGGIGTKIIDGVKSVFANAGNWLGTLFTSARDAIFGEDGPDFSSVGQTILDAVTGILSPKEGGNFLSKIFTDAETTINEIEWGTLGENVAQAGASMLNLTGEVLAAGFTAAESIVKNIKWGALGATVATCANGLVKLTGATLAGAFTAAESIINQINWSQLGETVGTVANSLVSLSGTALSAAFTAVESTIKGINWGALGAMAATCANGLIGLTDEALSGAFTAAQATISEIDWSGIGKTVGTVANGLIDLTGETLSGAFTLAASTIKNIKWGAIGATVATVANGLIKVTDGMLSGAFETAYATISAIEWSSLGETVGSVANGLIGLTGETLAGAFKAAESTIKGINWGALGATVATCANGMIKLTDSALSGAFTLAYSTISALDWAGIGTTLGTVSSELIKNSGEVLAEPFKAAHDILIGINWTEVGASIQQGVGDVWTGITGFLGGLLSGAGAAIEGVGEGVGAAAEGIGKAIAKLFSGEDAKQAAEDLKQAMEDMNTALSDGKKTVDATAKSIGTGILSSLEDGLSVARLNSIGQRVVTGIDGGIGLKAADLATTVSTLQSDTKAGFEGGKTYWSDVGSYIVGQVESGIGLKSVGFTKNSGVLMDNAIKEMKGKDWVNVGAAVVQGIVAGINAWSYYLYNTMYTIARNALAAAKDALGIASPSKVMRDQVGQWIPAGIAEGVTKNADMVTQAMDELARDTTAAGIGMAAAVSKGTSMGNGIATGASAASAGTGSAAYLQGMAAEIVEAIREGMRNAKVHVYIDGRELTDEISQRLGEAVTARRFA